jgi:hypothetical protein
MEILRWKTRISILWVIKAMGFSAYTLTALMQPGTIKEVMAGTLFGAPITAQAQLFVTFFWWIPWVLAWLSLTLKDTANKWTNLVFGILLALGLIGSLIQDASHASIALFVNYIVGIVVSLLIAWYAWKWPKQQG